MPDLSIWIAWIAGLGIAAALIALTWHALFGDRSDGRRCPRCLHNLQGTESLRCAECGHVARSERALHATKRHYGRAIAYLTMLVGGALFVRFKATQQGPMAFLPTSVILWLLPGAPPTQGPLGDVQSELIDRLVAGTLDEESLLALADLLVAGDPTAAPASPEWQTRYSRVALELVNAAAASIPDTPVWRAAQRLRALPADATIRVGRAIQATSEIPADINVLDWWPLDTHAHVRVRDVASGREYEWLYDATARRRPIALRLEPAGVGETERAFEISIRTRPTRETLVADGQPERTWGDERVHTLTVPLQPPMGRSLEPISSPELDLAIDDLFKQGVMFYRDGEIPVAFRLAIDRTRDVAYDGILFGVRIDLIEGEEVRRTLDAWWPGGPRGGGWRAEIVSEDLPALRRLPADGAGWSLRVRGIEEVAARAFVPTPADPSAMVKTADDAAPGDDVPLRWWSGERTLPVSVTVSEQRAPRRSWRPIAPGSTP